MKLQFKDIHGNVQFEKELIMDEDDILVVRARESISNNILQDYMRSLSQIRGKTIMFVPHWAELSVITKK